ncbi:hypothetical protein BH20ACT5_BH20ACT5_17000 [soil metagenome]
MASDLGDFDREITGFQDRLEELRAAYSLRPQDDPTVAATFLELETAAEELRVAHEELTSRGEDVSSRQVGADRDRQLMRAVFRDLPLPLFLLDRDGRIRRSNQRGGEVLSAPTDYVSGKPFPAFVHVPLRAAFRSELAAVLRGQGERVLATSLLREGAEHPARLMLSLVQVPADPRPLVAVLVLPSLDPGHRQADRPKPPAEGRQPVSADSDITVRSVTWRLDLTSALTRILLDEHGRTEAATLQAIADLLCVEFADWVLIDLVRRAELTRAIVCGPSDADARALTVAVERADVGKGELPCAVIDGDGPVLEAHLEDLDLLGADDRGIPFLTAMAGHSVICIRLALDGDPIGAITAVRTTGRPPFGLIDLALLQDLADHLARALRTQRRIHRRDDLADAVRGRLLPATVRTPPGVEIATLVRAADDDAELVGDFFDVFESQAGWGIMLGEAAGTGDAAAAQAAVVRHAIRSFALTTDDPLQWLRLADEAVRRLPDSDRTVRVVTAALTSDPAGGLELTLASAGNLSSLLIRADGRVQRVDGGGRPLGTNDGPEQHQDSLTVSVGDCLLMFSPAMLDLTNEQDERFDASGALTRGMARASGQSATAILTALDNELLAFARSGRRRDIGAIAICPAAVPSPA